MKASRIALIIAIAAAALLLVAGPGTRLGLWDYGLGLTLLRYAVYAGLAASALALLLIVIPKTRRGQVAVLVAALAIGLGVTWVPWSQRQTARSLPFIHDITTDTVNPPLFVDVVPLRADARNPVEYLGEEIAAQQREGYPDLAPVELTESPGETFENALRVSRDMGWEIVAEAPGEGRIEATDTTFWFGFKDDVVIRIAESGTGSRLDIRSKSRVGQSDVGANAARIREFIDRLT